MTPPPPPSAPTGLSVTPASGSNDNNPVIRGTAPAGTTVKLYTTASCTGSPVASGTAAAFGSTGFSAAVADNSTTTFRATAENAGGHLDLLQRDHLRRGHAAAQPPAAPTGLSVTPVSGSNDNSPKISGSAEAGTTVRVYTTAGCTGSPAATGTAATSPRPG